jgi:hypothetical protein
VCTTASKQTRTALFAAAKDNFCQLSRYKMGWPASIHCFVTQPAAVSGSLLNSPTKGMLSSPTLSLLLPP